MLKLVSTLTIITALSCSTIFADIDNKVNNDKQAKIDNSLKETNLEMKIRKKIAREMKENKAEQELTKTKPEHHSIWHQILFYIPNRLIDLTDIITLEAGAGPEASFNLTLTKLAQFGGSYGDRYFVEKGYNRQYGGGYSSGYNAAFACLNNEQQIVDYTFGTVKPYVLLAEDRDIIPCPYKPPYYDGLVDYWQIGVKLGWIVDFGVSIHPIAIANFFTGFFFVRLTDTEDL